MTRSFVSWLSLVFCDLHFVRYFSSVGDYYLAISIERVKNLNSVRIRTAFYLACAQALHLGNSETISVRFCVRVACSQNLKGWGERKKQEPTVVSVRFEINSLFRLTDRSSYQSGMNQSVTTGNDPLGQCSFKYFLALVMKTNLDTPTKTYRRKAGRKPQASNRLTNFAKFASVH